MAKERLTELAIKQAKFRDKQYKLSDGGGLFLLVHPNGSKYWRFLFLEIFFGLNKFVQQFLRNHPNT